MSSTPRRIHLLGICGTAMAALAGSLQAQGRRVTGSDDHVYPPMSEHLRALGIAYNEGYRAENIPADVELVVVGNVIRESNPEAAEMRRRGVAHLSMAEAVRRFVIGERTAIAVVGTHGKTTTTSLAAHLLVRLGADPGFLVGGIAANFGTNFRVGGGRWFVIEGDEYDTAYFDKTPKFFKYAPGIVILTSLEFDHADIYPNLDAIRVQFARLLAGLPGDGLLIACADDPEVRALLPGAACPVVTYGFAADADVRLADWQAGPDGARFALTHEGARRDWRSPLPGRHNALNVAAVLALSHRLGYDDRDAQAALDAFAGVRRRQEVRGTAGGVTVIDDFAHHPTAVAATVEAIRCQYPGRRLWAVFEPRSYTARSARFRAEFEEALAGAERVLLARPYRSDYSAGVEGLDTAGIAAALRGRGGWAEAPGDTDALLARLSAGAEPGDVVLIMSNGGFDNLHDRLLAALAEREGAGGRPAPSRETAGP